MSKPWSKTSTQLNTVQNTTDLITPSMEKPILNRMNVTPAVPIVKRDSNILSPNMNMNSTFNPMGNANLMANEHDSNLISNPTANSSDMTGSLQNSNSTMANTNINTSAYGGMSGGYGGGMGGYGSSYGGMGGYGSSYGGMGGYGSSYGGMGGMGGMGGYGMGGYNRFGNPGEQQGVLDQCFMIVERMNYQMYHFCEMTRMIQAQSASLAYFMEIMTKVYAWTKSFVTTKTMSFMNTTKLAVIQRLLRIKEIIKEFFSNKEVEDNKLKSHIKALDYIITLLLITAVAGLFIKVY